MTSSQETWGLSLPRISGLWLAPGTTYEGPSRLELTAPALGMRFLTWEARRKVPLPLPEGF